MVANSYPVDCFNDGFNNLIDTRTRRGAICLCYFLEFFFYETINPYAD